MEPWPHQMDAVAAFHAYDGTLGAMVVCATGGGKTVLASLAMEKYLDDGKRVLWLAHRHELVEQPQHALASIRPGIVPGVVRAGRKQLDRQVTYASHASMVRPATLEAYLSHGPPALVVIDECHHSTAAGWQKVMAALRATGCKFLGLTATPFGRLEESWHMVYSLSILDAIDRRVLVPPYASHVPIPGFDITKVRVERGEYSAADLEAQLMKAHIIEHTVAVMTRQLTYERLPFREKERVGAVDGPALVFTVTVAQAHSTVDALRAAGWTADAVWGEMPSRDRAEKIEAFKSGGVQVLVNAGVLTEGTDLPCAQYAVLARGCRSQTLYMQIVGRVLRRFQDKDAGYVIDLCGASKEHDIVSAPVLVSGNNCDASHNGRHEYIRIEGTCEGVCRHCGLTIKCFDKGGSHDFRAGVCRACGAAQCEESPTLEHHWLPWERGMRICAHCDCEIRDPLLALAGRQLARREPVAWKRLPFRVQLYACALGPDAVMYMQVSDAGLRPWLWSRAGLQPVTNRPVDKHVARMLTDDIARRAKKVEGYYGGAKSREGMRRKLADAARIAKEYGLHQEGGPSRRRARV